jgi:hypothetical protein
MRMYIITLKLNDFFVFSSHLTFSEIKGVSYTVYRPSQYIHNYPLMYALTDLLYVSLASPTITVDEIEYKDLDAIEKILYVYPARPRSIRLMRLLGNIRGEGFAEPSEAHPKTIYPWHVAHIVFTPGSIFESVLITYEDDIRLPKTIRIGVKRQGVFTVEYHEADITGFIDGFSDPINLGDVVRRGLRPDSFTKLLETRTRRKNAPGSNMIVIGEYRRRMLSIIKANINGEEIVFRLPLLGRP